MCGCIQLKTDIQELAGGFQLRADIRVLAGCLHPKRQGRPDTRGATGWLQLRTEGWTWVAAYNWRPSVQNRHTGLGRLASIKDRRGTTLGVCLQLRTDIRNLAGWLPVRAGGMALGGGLQLRTEIRELAGVIQLRTDGRNLGGCLQLSTCIMALTKRTGGWCPSPKGRDTELS